MPAAVKYPSWSATRPASDLRGFVFHAEICEDYWAPTPPSTQGALAGALICCNLSASNIVIGKARERMMLASAQSAQWARPLLLVKRSEQPARRPCPEPEQKEPQQGTNRRRRIQPSLALVLPLKRPIRSPRSA